MRTIRKIEEQNVQQNASFLLGLNNFSDSNDNEYNEMSEDSYVLEFQDFYNKTLQWQELASIQNKTNVNKTIQTIQKLIDVDYFSKIKAYDSSFDKKS
jgi:hypothetical protein